MNADRAGAGQSAGHDAEGGPGAAWAGAAQPAGQRDQVFAARCRITISLKADEEGALLAIADQVPALDEAEMPFVFDRFFRGCARVPGMWRVLDWAWRYRRQS
jgi:hypothetical protein